MTDIAHTATAAPAVDAPLPELASVHWRPRVDDRRLQRAGRGWTLSTLFHVIPFTVPGIVLLYLQPLALPVALGCFAHAWIIPALYAQRGANVVRPKPTKAGAGPEARALGLLGDLVGHEARDLHGASGLILERGRLGVWLLGPAGALLVRPGGRRTHCYCVRVNDPDLPTADRIAHLLLALRADESGFATVGNHSFSGATWRVRRRLTEAQRPALDRARELARAAA